MVTFAEASRCPKCGQPGQKRKEHAGRKGAIVHELWCQNARCSWYDTMWVVEVKSDGTIPVRG